LNDVNITFMNKPVSGWVITNDIDPDDDELTVKTTLVSNPANGQVALNSNGSYTYSPNAGFTGKDSFTYEICDQDGMCDQAKVAVSVIPLRIENKNRQPIAVDDNYIG